MNAFAITRSPVADLSSALACADRAMTDAAIALADLLGSGAIEAETGLSPDLWTRLDGRLARWDARTLLGVAETLRAMPGARSALSDGRLSWSQCRAIVRACRDLRAPDRPTVDASIARWARELTDAEPEEIVARVEDLVARLRDDLVRRREERASFLVLSPRLDGGGALYGEADAERFATIAEALDAAADRPMGDEAADLGDPTARARQRMDALVGICESSLAGDASGTRPRPRFLATLDLAQMNEMGLGEAARVLWRIAGRPARLSLLTTETLACDAEFVPVLFDGARPIAVGDATATVPGKVRTAIVARDQGCRFPGCGAPASWCDVHHITPRHAGGGGAVENLVLLCRRCHRRVHAGPWRIAWEPAGGISFTRRGRRYRSTRE